MSANGITRIMLDKERILRFDLNALVEIETGLGIRLGDKLTIGAKEIRVLLWAGLVHEDPALTITQVGGWVTAENFARVAGDVGVALAAAFGSAEGNPPTPEALGTGALSGGSGSAPSV